MLSFAPTTKIFLVTGSTDMRKSFDTLAAIVTEQLAASPYSGQVFVFANRQRNRVKVLLWDRAGFWLCAKRLEEGTFAWPDSEDKSIALSSTELAILLDGIDLQASERRKWYSRPESGGERMVS